MSVKDLPRAYAQTLRLRRRKISEDATSFGILSLSKRSKRILKLEILSWIQCHDKRSSRAYVCHEMCRDTIHPALKAPFSAGPIRCTRVTYCIVIWEFDERKAESLPDAIRRS